MNTTETMRHLAAIGPGTPLTVFVWIVAAGLPVRQEWLEAMTLTSDKTIKPALERLANLEYIAKASGGWIVAPGRQGVLGEVLAALAPGLDRLAPAVEEKYGNSVSADTHTDDDDGTTPAGQNENTEFPSSLYGVGVVVKDLNITTDSKTDSLKQHQHQHGEKDGNSDSARAAAMLERLGCWENRARKIAAGLHPSRGLGIVMGWIAYARDEENGVHSPAALVAGHLETGQEPASKWVPPRICRTCRLAEGLCACEAMDFYYPADFDDLAFEAPPNYDTAAWLANRWRCDLCGGHPCQCENLETDS